MRTATLILLSKSSEYKLEIVKSKWQVQQHSDSEPCNNFCHLIFYHTGGESTIVMPILSMAIGELNNYFLLRYIDIYHDFSSLKNAELIEITHEGAPNTTHLRGTLKR